MIRPINVIWNQGDDEPSRRASLHFAYKYGKVWKHPEWRCSAQDRGSGLFQQAPFTPSWSIVDDVAEIMRELTPLPIFGVDVIVKDIGDEVQAVIAVVAKAYGDTTNRLEFKFKRVCGDYSLATVPKFLTRLAELTASLCSKIEAEHAAIFAPEGQAARNEP